MAKRSDRTLGHVVRRIEKLNKQHDSIAEELKALGRTASRMLADMAHGLQAVAGPDPISAIRRGRKAGFKMSEAARKKMSIAARKRHAAAKRAAAPKPTVTK